MKYNEAWMPIQNKIGVSVDGYAGPDTLKAIAGKIGCNPDWWSVQAKAGTSIDGDPGPRTIKAVRIALGMDKPEPCIPGTRHVVIDIGHANGTGSSGNGIEEHAVNVAIAGMLREKLRDAGHKVTVVDYPEQSNRDDLNQTIRFLNAMDYDCAVSLHSDWSTLTTSRGGHVCYKRGYPAGKAFAEAMSKPLVALLPGRAEPVMARSDLGILNQTHKPVILCEGGFITNVHDASIMGQMPELIAQAYCDGICSYLGKGM